MVVEDGDYQKICAAMKRVSEFSGYDMAAGRPLAMQDLAEMERDLDEIGLPQGNFASEGRISAALPSIGISANRRSGVTVLRRSRGKWCDGKY